MDNQLDLSYQEIKAQIRGELNQVAESFVAIGYRLKQVKDGELYKEDGYQNINEFAMKEYHLSQSSTSRFIAINNYFSIDGNSQKLLPDYEGYGFSKLSEMLTLSEEEMKLISIRTTVAEIRTIKEVKKAPGEGENEDIYATSHKPETLDNTQSEQSLDTSRSPAFRDGISMTIEFFRDKSRRNMLKELADLLSNGVSTGSVSQRAAEIINPSGHLMFKKGLVILVFEEDKIKYNKFGGQTQEYTYLDFMHDTALAFDISSQDPWVDFYGEPEPDPIPEPKPEPKKEPVKENKPAPAKGKDDNKSKKPTAPTPEVKKKPQEEEDTEEEELPGQYDVEDYPELLPEPQAEKEEVEIMEADIIMTPAEGKEESCIEEILFWHPMTDQPEGNQYVLLAIMHNGLPDVVMGHYHGSAFHEEVYNGKGCIYQYWAYKPKSPILMNCFKGEDYGKTESR